METDIVIREVEIATDIERKRQRERDKEIEIEVVLDAPLLLLWARIPSPVADQQPKWRSAKRMHSMAELAIKVPEQLCNECRILGLKRHTAASQENPSLGVGQGTLLLRGSGFGFRILGLGFLHLLARATHHADELLRLFGLFR